MRRRIALHPRLARLKDLTAIQQVELCKRKQRGGWSPHRLRHSAATEIGFDTAQVVLGHAMADMTQIYAELRLAMGVEVARKIG